MPDASASRLRARLGLWLPLAVTALAVAVGAFALLFSTFMIYDDEGYVLLSLQTFVDGGGLYERVYSQYGPFFFLFHQLLHGLGLPFDNTGARLLVLAYWLGTAGFCGALVWRLTHSVVAVVFTLAGVFRHLWPLASEPSHPGGIIVFAVAALAWCGVAWSDRPLRLASAAGALVAALCLIKINVGVFALASLAAWGWLQAAPLAGRPVLRVGLAAAALAALPVLLMRPHLGTDWVLVFAVVIASAGLGTAFAALRPGPGPAPPGPTAVRFTLAGLAVTAATVLAIVTQGTSVAALLEGVILGPLRHPQVYSFGVKWQEGALPFALVSLALPLVASLRPHPAFDRLVAAGRLAAAAVFLATLVFDFSLNSHAFALSFALGTVGWFVYPLAGDTTPPVVRLWLGLLVVLQALHAFPVAGSQISWGTFLWIPLAAVGARDAWHGYVVPRLPSAPLRRFAGPAALALFLFVAARGTHAGLDRLVRSDSLGVPGAAQLRLPETFTTSIRILVQNAAVHADVLFSLPGMHSFHRWTGVPPPTTLNATHWFSLLSPARQDEIRDRLAASPRACVIVQRHVYDYLGLSGVATESPLTVWLKENFECAFSLQSYEFWVRKGRSIAPLGTVTIDEAAPGVSPRYRLNLTIAAPALTGIAAVELLQVDTDPPASVHRWTNANARFTVVPINSAGVPLRPPQPATLPLALDGLVRLELLTDELPPAVRYGFGLIHLRDAAGRRLAEARFVR